MTPEQLSEKVEILQNLLIVNATGGAASDADYARLRRELLDEPTIAALLPKFVRTCRDLSQFWGFIKREFHSYKERREFLWGQFRPVFDHLEGAKRSPVSSSVITELERLDFDSVHDYWNKALQRKTSDPEGAITSARSLLESVCKGILDYYEVEYAQGGDLPSLYKAASRELNLSPTQHTEQVFKKILTGCVSVVDGLASLRNSLSDAHGQGVRRIRPSERHAEFAVNLAGTMATFLLATWQVNKTKAAD